MSTPEYRAAPALMAAVREALALCVPMWPRALAHLTQQSQASHDWLTHYARACGSSDHDLIVEAARRWCASEGFAPKPADLGKLARELTAQRRGSAPTPVATDVPADLLDGARPFWFAKAGAEEGPYRLDAERAIGMAVVRGALAGGSLGISEGEMDQLQAGAIPWGWLTPLEVPKPAVPAGWHERTLSRGRAA